MVLTAKILVFAVSGFLRVATGFDIGLSTKCVVIPKEMDMCHKIGYSEMRLPNLMGHTSMAEVILKSTTWQHLVHTDCHPHVRTFLCSLFAPICLDTFIHPCRSMCVAVRDSCAPVLACHGHPWPDSLDCDRFPADEDMCLASLTKEYKYLHKVLPKPACQTCPAVEEFFTHKRVLEVLCDSNFVTGNTFEFALENSRKALWHQRRDSQQLWLALDQAVKRNFILKSVGGVKWAVKVKLSKKRTVFGDQQYNIECQVEFMTQGSLLPYETQSMIQKWLLINENCTQRMTPTHRPMVYLLVGNIEEGIILVNQVYRWQKRESQLNLATQKWRYHKCL